MKAILTQDEFESASEAVQAEYHKQENGMYLLKVEAVHGFSLENVEGLKNTVATTRRERDEAKAKLKDLEGLDPDAARDALAKVKEMANWTPEQKVKEQIEAAVKEIKTKAQQDLEAAQSDTGRYKGQLSQVLVDNAAREALGGHKLIDGVDHSVFMPHIRDAVSVVEDNGQMFVRVKGQDGGHRVSMKQGSTDPMGLKEFIDLLPQDPRFKGLFAASGKTGSGGQNGQPHQQSQQRQPVGATSGEGSGTVIDPVERLAQARRSSG